MKKTPTLVLGKTPKISRFVIIFLLLLTFQSTQAQVPSISSFSPTSGAIGTTVTITGPNFNATANQNIVLFGATKATVTTASATSLTVTVHSVKLKERTKIVAGLAEFLSLIIMIAV